MNIRHYLSSIAAVAATAMLSAAPVLAQEAATTSSAASTAANEWPAYIEPLLPLGERLTAKMTGADDPQLRAELYKLVFSQISSGYFALLYADPKHPDFWPIFNEAYNLFGPNTDNSYSLTPIDGDGVYKISGFRGTVKIVDLSVSGGTFLPYGSGDFGKVYGDYDLDTLHIKKDGSFEVILSNERPKGYKGDWWKLDTKANYILVRQLSLDWLHENDARLAIDRLDQPSIKPRPTAQELDAKMRQIPVWAENWTSINFRWLQNYLKHTPVNSVYVHSLSSQGGLSTQEYIEGQFEIAPDEALIYETEVPKTCRYWGVQVMDMLMVAIDWMNRQSSLNAHSARIDKDGKFRAVLAGSDPGVPNWLDTAGYRKGGIIGRWTECSSNPTPTITKVKLADVRKHLPADTPVVTAEARDASLRLRRKGAQLRRRW